MDVRITPHPLQGAVHAIPSKSVAHRLLLLSAFVDGPTDLLISQGSQDIDATVRCIEALGGMVHTTDNGYRVEPVPAGATESAQLDVGESGSTLRFVLPVLGALGRSAELVCAGRLSERPLAPLDEQLAQHGVVLARHADTLRITGQLEPGRFLLPGNVSSQYISGLLMAAPLIRGEVTVAVVTPVESRPYIDLTIEALKTFGIVVQQHDERVDGVDCHCFTVPSEQRLTSPGRCEVEGDWSNAAFWLAAGSLQDDPLSVTGVDPFSRQGDRAIMACLALFGAHVGRSAGIVAASRDQLRGQTLNISDIPDLAAPLAAVASMCEGTTHLVGAARLRLKESDRLSTICNALNALGGQARIQDDGLVIEGVSQLAGGEVDAANDHRIAMMATICATFAAGPSVIHGCECVAKSYPTFFDDFRSLGGRAEEEG